MLHHFCATLAPEINQKYCGINSFEVFPAANISQEKNTIYFYGPTLAAVFVPEVGQYFSEVAHFSRGNASESSENSRKTFDFEVFPAAKVGL